jgi:hypothetical protein
MAALMGGSPAPHKAAKPPLTVVCPLTRSRSPLTNK